jgi:diguanylate cyclase (GGDEF)-like protein
MRTAQLTDQVRKRLSALLAEDRPDAGRLLGRLRELRTLEQVSACSAVIELLAHVELPEEKAEQLLVDLLRHREIVRDGLGRDPGLRVAALDFLCNVHPMLRSPTIVELAQFEQTERSAITDDLTGLHNRRYFHQALEFEIRRSRRYSASLSLLMLDLDAFKSVNDLYGHPFGDLVLRQAGLTIRRALRESDLPCRVGGEEFAIILTETTASGAETVAERLRESVEQEFRQHPVGGRVVAITVSGGIAAFPEHAQEPEELLERVDCALYRSKTGGRNKISVFSGERRASPRFPIAPDVPFRVRGQSSPGYGVNLSRGGALLELGLDELTADDPVVLTLVDRRSRPDDRWVVDGRVVRVESRPGPRGRRVAVAFDALLPERCPVRGVVVTDLTRSIEGEEH